MIYYDSYEWYDDLQVCLDLLTEHRTKGKFLQAMPVYQSNDDRLFSTQYQYPRLAGGNFGVCLKALYNSITGNDLKIVSYGKPTTATYNYAERMLKNLSKNKINRFYGIGDNPKSDIKGANEAGNQWTSILVYLF